MKKLKYILLELFKYIFTKANLVYSKEKQLHKKYRLYFKKSLTLSKL